MALLQQGALMGLDSAQARELASIKYALDQAAIVAITDRAGKIIHANDKFCEITGYAREELLGKNHRIINSGHHPKSFFTHMWQQISSGKVWVGEIRNRRKDGSLYWVYTTIIPFLDDKEEPYQYVSIRFEITQRKEAEAKLRTYATRLEQSNEELQQFASVAAHDLQEPLRKILAFGDRLMAKCKDVVPPEGVEYLERITSSARRMQALIDDLLTYSRVTSRAQPFTLCNLDVLVREVLSDLEFRLERTGGQVEVGPLPEIEADASQLRQLFQNLIGNALKFHRPGVAPVVKVSAQIDTASCVISVTDNGIGFDEKYLDRIFVIFQRLHGRGEYEGNGVGLAVCRRIAERHGGSLNARSTPGAGATFYISIPLRQAFLESSQQEGSGE